MSILVTFMNPMNNSNGRKEKFAGGEILTLFKCFFLHVAKTKNCMMELSSSPIFNVCTVNHGN
jgi:hypothetical protein